MASHEPGPEIYPYDASADPLEEVRASGETRVRVTRPEGVMVVLGRASKPEVELRLEACLEDRVPLLRRPGGGCSVVLDPGNLVVSLAYPVQGIGAHRQAFEEISAWLLSGLAEVGIGDLRREDVSDLARGDRKVGGASMYRPRGRLLYGASLLMRPRLDLMDRYLAHPPREPAYRRGRTHGEFVTALLPLTGGPDLDDLARRLESELDRTKGRFP